MYVLGASNDSKNFYSLVVGSLYNCFHYKLPGEIAAKFLPTLFSMTVTCNARIEPQ